MPATPAQSDTLGPLAQANALHGRVAVITGASSGIGAATARRLSQSGAAVVLVARRQAAIDALAAELLSAGGTALAIKADVTSLDALTGAADRVRAEVGPTDLLLNNAGVMYAAPVADGRADEWQAMADTNFIGVLNTTSAFLPDMVASARAGRQVDLVNVSSIAGLSMFAPEYAAYNGTKAAVNAVSKTLRAELAPEGIRVTDIEPGLAATEAGQHLRQDKADRLYARHQALSPDEVADAIAYIVALPSHVNVPQMSVTPVTQ